MKAITVFTIVLLFAVTASAQQTIPELKIQIPQLKKLDVNAPFIVAPKAVGQSSSYGEVYNLQPDNMPCLVPIATATSPMPVAITPLPEAMPNAVPGFKVKPSPFKTPFLLQKNKNSGTTP